MVSWNLQKAKWKREPKLEMMTTFVPIPAQEMLCHGRDFRPSRYPLIYTLGGYCVEVISSKPLIPAQGRAQVEQEYSGESANQESSADVISVAHLARQNHKFPICVHSCLNKSLYRKS
jgi:hypothetical protein